MDNLILVTGSEGMVGSRFLEISDHKKLLHPPKQVELDITKPPELKALLTSYDFFAIINFAAFTDVDVAEGQRGDKEGDCWQINVEGVRNLVESIKPYQEKVHFVQISTDMVYPADKEEPGPYSEDYPPETKEEKLTWYGYTKAEAERIVMDELKGHASVLRIMLPVRTEFEGKKDWLRKALELYDAGDMHPYFTDQQITFTFIDEACMALDRIIGGNLFGSFHAASKNTTTPYKTVSYLLERTKGKKDAVKAMTVNEYLKDTGKPSFRVPRFGGLKVDKSENELGMTFSTWKEIIDRLVLQGIDRKS